MTQKKGPFYKPEPETPPPPEESTLTAPIPKELLSKGSLFRSQSSGLGQLFGKRGAPDEFEIDALLEKSIGSSMPPPKKEAGDGLLEALSDSSRSTGPTLHVPDERVHDPDETTSAFRAPVGLPNAPEPEVEESPTELRFLPLATSRVIPEREAHSQPPEPAVLEDSVKAALLERATWLLEEARLRSGAEEGRGRLFASELFALASEADKAWDAVNEPAPDELPLLRIQKRKLQENLSHTERAVLLEDEAVRAPTVEAKLHATLLGAECHRLAGDPENAARMLHEASALAPSDPGVMLSQTLLQLAYGASPLPSPQAERSARLRGAAETVLAFRGAHHETSDPVVTARRHLATGELALATTALTPMRTSEELGPAATWVMASLFFADGKAKAAAAPLLLDLLAEGDHDAARPLVRLGLSMGDPGMVETSLKTGTFALGDELSIRFLAGLPMGRDKCTEAYADRALAPLVSAMAAQGLHSEEDAAYVVIGPHHAELLLARFFALGVSDDRIAKVADGDLSPALHCAVRLFLALRRFPGTSLSRTLLEELPGRSDVACVAGLIAESEGDVEEARKAYGLVNDDMPHLEGVYRALSELDPHFDLTRAHEQALLTLADSDRKASLALELGGKDLAQAGHLDVLAKLPLYSVLSSLGLEQQGGEPVLLSLREGRNTLPDPFFQATSLVREARVLADQDPHEAALRLEQAMSLCPEDAAIWTLRERYVDVPSPEPAQPLLVFANIPGEPLRAPLRMATAYFYEVTEQFEKALSIAEEFEHGGLTELHERLELRLGQAARVAEVLLPIAKNGEGLARREALFELARMDQSLGDEASALLWHKTILETWPEYLPSLRYVEHALLTANRADELEPVFASLAGVLSKRNPGAGAAHAFFAARARIRAGGFRDTKALAYAEGLCDGAPLWAVRYARNHARRDGELEAVAKVSEALSQRLTRPLEKAVLLIQAAEATTELGRYEAGLALLRAALAEDPGDVYAWGLLADLAQRAGRTEDAAEACEALVRTSVVPEHRVLAGYDAGRMWADELANPERATRALAAVAEVNLGFEDTFSRLSALYDQRGAYDDLAALLLRRMEYCEDAGERVALLVERGKVLIRAGDFSEARTAFESALEIHEEDLEALTELADILWDTEEWEPCEKILVRLCRLAKEPKDQVRAYRRLAELYHQHLGNMSRAEVAYKEILKHAPELTDVSLLLVDVYRKQGDAPKAIHVLDDLIARAESREVRRDRMLDLASVLETVAKDPRKAEQALEAARKEGPTDLSVLRPFVAFYQRQKQGPAIGILLDRAAGDVRRALSQGRFQGSFFEVLGAAYELRGRADAALVVRASHKAFVGEPSPLSGAGVRALDPRVDDVVAPEVFSPALRTLLVRTADALELAFPLDLRALGAEPDGSNVTTLVRNLAGSVGLGQVDVLVSRELGATCLPMGGDRARIVVGEALAKERDEATLSFLLLRAMKCLQARTSFLVRTNGPELRAALGAWLHLFHPHWSPPQVPKETLRDLAKRITTHLPKGLGPELGILALEVQGAVGNELETLGPLALSWANRTALLGLGDLGASVRALGVSSGHSLPEQGEARTEYLAGHAEAKDLFVWSASEGYMQARARLGITPQ